MDISAHRYTLRGIMDSVERVYAYLALRTDVNPDNVIDSYGTAELTITDLRDVLLRLRELKTEGQY